MYVCMSVCMYIIYLYRNTINFTRFNAHISGIFAQFSQNQYTAHEADGYATFTVTLSGNKHRKFPISVYLGVYVSDKFQPKAGTYIWTQDDCLIVYMFLSDTL